MEYMTVQQTAEKWGVSMRRVQFLLKENRIDGAIRPARDWLIPMGAEKLSDARIKSGKYIKRERAAHTE